ncbi:MAG: glycosyltransferase family 1 protein [Gammaproteobacteria bacterium]|nr:MAG: glycosyltransferase family 1 protein [Gammaproteobacteria bacterium]
MPPLWSGWLRRRQDQRVPVANHARAGRTCAGRTAGDQAVKVALIRQQFRPDGGAERMVMNTIQALSGKQVELSVIAHQWQPAGTTGMPVEFLQAERKGLTRAAKLRTFTAAVQERLRAHPFDIVQSFERVPGVQIYRAGDGVHATWLEQKARMDGPLSRWWTRHDHFHRAVMEQESALYAHPALRKVICISEMIRKDVMLRFGVSPEQAVTVYNGVDLTRFRPREKHERQAIRQRLGLPKCAPILLYVGSGFQRKGVDILLQAAATLPEDLHWVICGHDKAIARYQKRAHQLGLSGRIHFAGPQADIADWYALADALVHPAWYEPFGNVVLEALASGVGVIATDRTGASELLTPGCGAVVPAGNAGELADAIRRHLADFESWRTNARKVAEDYPLSRMSASLLSLYQEILET